jgi:menaquinone-9 beta-reductase
MHPITIVGGGLAGLALGIGLRRAGVPARILEAGDYPRHRVCGEFISGPGQEVLDRLGLIEALKTSGVLPARTGAIFIGGTRSPVRPFPKPALCISRYELDRTLAEVFTGLGGRLQTRTRVPQREDEPGTVWASGRKPMVKEEGWRWFGLKAHARNVKLDADLEMHAVPEGYVGLCGIPGGNVNVCGLFRRDSRNTGWENRRTGMSTLRGPPGSVLHERLAGAEFDEGSFCSVAGLGWKGNPPRDVCSIGDAFAMTPPVTGNGMSIALETAEIALDPLVEFSKDRIAWSNARDSIFASCHSALSARLRWAGWLHRAIMSERLRTRFGPVFLGSDLLWRFMFRATRTCGRVV